MQNGIVLNWGKETILVCTTAHFVYDPRGLR